jgi:hypothetical protein
MPEANDADRDRYRRILTEGRTATPEESPEKTTESEDAARWRRIFGER